MSLLANYKPLENINSLTLRDVIKQNPPSLRRWALTIGAYDVQKQIVKLIVNVQKQLNTGKGLIIDEANNINQPATASALIYANFGNRISIEDLALAFNMGLMSEPGFKKVFDSFDITIMSDWIQNYLIYKQQRIDGVASSIQREERLALNPEPQKPLTDEEREEIKKIKEQTLKLLEKTRKNFAQKDQQTKKRELTEHEKHYVELMQQFDLIWSREDQRKSGVLNQKVIIIDGDELTIEEYLKKNQIIPERKEGNDETQ